jgi:hypothetical protein
MRQIARLRGSICCTAVLVSACTTPDTLVRSEERQASSAHLVAQRPPAVCEEECLGVLRAGVVWLAGKNRVSPSMVVIDTVRINLAQKAPPGSSRVLAGPVFKRLAALAGTERGTRDEVVACVQLTGAGLPSCRVQDGKVLVVLLPPLSDPARPMEASLTMISEDSYLYMGRWRLHAAVHHLTLKKENGEWRISTAQVGEET